MKEKFYVLSRLDEFYEFESWDELIREIHTIEMFRFGHNFNDTYRVDNPLVYRPVDFVVFDSLWRVVSVQSLINAVSNFTYKRRKYSRWAFEYRKEPVPRTGGGGRFHGSSVFRRRNKNKRAAIILNEDKDLFPNDDSGNRRTKLVKSWGDELSMRSRDKSWKRQNKIRKQWMKHIS